MGTGEKCAAFSAFAEMGIFRRQAANARAEGEIRGRCGAREGRCGRVRSLGNIRGASLAATAALPLFRSFASVDRVAHAFLPCFFCG
jgi:hypothetical protein